MQLYSLDFRRSGGPCLASTSFPFRGSSRVSPVHSRGSFFGMRARVYVKLPMIRTGGHSTLGPYTWQVTRNKSTDTAGCSSSLETPSEGGVHGGTERHCSESSGVPTFEFISVPMSRNQDQSRRTPTLLPTQIAVRFKRSVCTYNR